MPHDPTARYGSGWRFMGTKAVYDQRSRIDERKERWNELHQLAEENNVVGFYRRYVDYLEWDGIDSPSRKVIHKMAMAVITDGAFTTSHGLKPVNGAESAEHSNHS